MLCSGYINLSENIGNHNKYPMQNTYLSTLQGFNLDVTVHSLEFI